MAHQAVPADVSVPESVPGLTSDPAAPPALGPPAALAGLPDLRRRRGVRHGPSGIVAVVLAAVLVVAPVYAAIGRWAGELRGAQLVALGVDRRRAPEASTLPRVFAALATAALDALVGALS